MSHLHYSPRHTAAIAVVRAAAPALCLAVEHVSDLTIARQEAKEHLERVCDARSANPNASVWDKLVHPATERVRLATEALTEAEASLDLAALEHWHVLEGAVHGAHDPQQIAIA